MTQLQPMLEYASNEKRPPPGPFLWRAALVCGLLPLIVGVGDILIWLATSSRWTVHLGLMTLVSGPFIVFAGFVSSAIYAGLRARAGVRWNAWLRTLFLFLLLYAGDFAAAFGCLGLASVVPPKHSVQIVNDTTQRIDSLAIRVDDKRVPLGVLAPGQQLRHSWRQKSGLPPQVEFTFAGTATKFAPVDNYFDGGPEGTSSTFMIRPTRVLSNGNPVVPSTQPIDFGPVR